MTGSPLRFVRPSGSDASVVEAQLGRPPRGDWLVAARCRWGCATVLAVAPVVDGEPFPTTLWLTCPWLRALVDGAESTGATARWTARVAADPHLAERVLVSDRSYRRLRGRLGSGADPCADVGIAGQADPLVVKCLHARVAAALGGPADPVGSAVLKELEAAGTPTECEDGRCRAFARRSDGADVG